MNENTKHKITTFVVAAIMVLVAMYFTDGVTDSWEDVFMILYPGAIVWTWLRLAGFLRFKK